MKTIRASACPRVMQCPASAFLSDDEIAIDEASDAAKLGTAVHAIAKDIVERGLTVGPQVESYAERYGVTDLTELRVLTAYVRQAWFGTDGKVGLRTYFPNPMVEHKMSTIINDEHGNPELELTGTEDLGYWGEDEARVGDYKSGRKEDTGQYEDQLAAYGYMKLCNSPHPLTVVKVFPIWLRDKYWDVRIYDWGELLEWKNRLRDKLREGPNSYCTGDHCHFCPKRFDCKARAKSLRFAIYTMNTGTVAEELFQKIRDGEEVPADFMLKMMSRLSQATTLIKGFNDDLKQIIKDTGPIRLDNGQTIELKERQGAMVIDSVKGMEVLGNHLNWDEFMPCVKITKGKLETALKLKVDKYKGAYCQSVMVELDEAGATSRNKPSYSLSVTKAPNGTKQIETTTTTQEEM